MIFSNIFLNTPPRNALPFQTSEGILSPYTFLQLNVGSTRAKYLLVWGVPKMNSEDKELLKSYGFVNGEDLI